MKLSMIDFLFQVDYKRLVLLLLPTFLRRPRVFAFLWAMTFSISKLHERFEKQRDKNRERIKCNGQICYLQGVLNNNLDDDARRISISEGEADGDWVLVWSEEIASQTLVCKEDGSTKKDPVHLVYTEGLIVANTALFIVSVFWEATDIDKENKLKNLLNEYKLLSKKYTIKYE